jgi:putative ABC transport system permease protein
LVKIRVTWVFTVASLRVSSSASSALESPRPIRTTGILGLHAVLPAMADAAQIVITEAMLRVYHPPLLALLALAGVGIAALGAFIPARTASRITVATALRSE